MKNFLQGKKTYLVAAVGILTALTGWSDGNLTNVEAIIVGMNALGLSTLRAGIGKAIG